MWRAVLAALLCALLTFGSVACGGDDEEVAATPTPTRGAAEQSGCERVDAPAPKGEQNLPEPTLELDPAKTYVASVLTSCGEFEITLDAERAPKTGGSFVELARAGFYDGLTFHRVSPGFVIQGGDPLGNGEGGPGYSIVEAPPADLRYEKGVVAMAKTAAEAPGTSGSQFFVMTEAADLPPDYALLGRVTGGDDVVARIGVVPVDPRERPVDPVVIRQISIEES